MDIDSQPIEQIANEKAQGQHSYIRPERVAISDPIKFDGDSRKLVNVHLWLRNLERYFKDKDQPYSKHGRLAGHWLFGQAQKLWECQLNDIEASRKANDSLNKYEQFTMNMKRARQSLTEPSPAAQRIDVDSHPTEQIANERAQGQHSYIRPEKVAISDPIKEEVNRQVTKLLQKGF